MKQLLINCALPSSETLPSGANEEARGSCTFRYFAQVDSGARIKIATLIKTGLRLQTDALHEALENRQRETYNEHRQALDRYILLNDWLFSLAEKILHTKSKTTNNSRSGASDAKAGAGTWQQQWITLRQEYLMILKTLAGLDLNRLWTVRTELHTFIKSFFLSSPTWGSSSETSTVLAQSHAIFCSTTRRTSRRVRYERVNCDN